MDHKLIKNNLKKVYQEFENCDCSYDLDSDAISIQSSIELSAPQKQILKDTALSMICWRQGPYKLFDLLIDSEWQCQIKWQRIKNYLGDLEGLDLADVGCSNGYYMYKALGLNPDSITGFDPFQICKYQFDFINFFVNDPRINFITKGVENLNDFQAAFDLILFMGVIYHRKDPLQTLKSLATALKPGGSVLIETMILPGAELKPQEIADRYSKMHNVYYLTSIDGLLNWLEQSGFSNYDILSVSQTSTHEQRTSEFSPYESLNEYLNSEDKLLTIEGLPAPRRILLKAHK